MQVYLERPSLALTCDRTSNGPHIYYLNPQGPGGHRLARGLGNGQFQQSSARRACLWSRTAENVPRPGHQITTSEQHDVALRRKRSIGTRLPTTLRFQKRYVRPALRGALSILSQDRDDAFFFGRRVQDFPRPKVSAKLKAGGGRGAASRLGGQTHPAGRQQRDHRDFSAQEPRALAVTRILHPACTASAPRGLTGVHAGSADSPRRVARWSKPGRQSIAWTPQDPQSLCAERCAVFAARPACRLARMNNYGCSLVWDIRRRRWVRGAVIELIEELALRGGGYGSSPAVLPAIPPCRSCWKCSDRGESSVAWA